jgi:hypothetical protein
MGRKDIAQSTLDVRLSFKLIDVSGMINVDSAEASEAKVLKMIKRAEVTLELETGKRLNHFYIGYALEVLIAGDKG